MPSIQLASFSGDPTHSPPFTFVEDLYFPIVLRKGKRSTVLYSLAIFLSCHSLSLVYHNFAIFFYATTIPKFYEKALTHPRWVAIMEETMSILKSRGT